MAIISKKTRNLISVDSESERNTRRARLLPVFVHEILTEDTSKSNHCTQEYIRKKLHASYTLDVDRRTVSRCLSSLMDEDLCIFGNPKEGYWYNRGRYYPE